MMPGGQEEWRQPARKRTRQPGDRNRDADVVSDLLDAPTDSVVTHLLDRVLPRRLGRVVTQLLPPRRVGPRSLRGDPVVPDLLEGAHTAAVVQGLLDAGTRPAIHLGHRVEVSLTESCSLADLRGRRAGGSDRVLSIAGERSS